MTREIPPDIKARWKAWGFWSTYWSWMHYITGFTSAALTVLIAANTKSPFLGPTTAVVVACIAAGLAFLVTAMGAQTRGKGFELAGRVLEASIAEYAHDSSIEEKTLGQSIGQGLKIMNDLK